MFVKIILVVILLLLVSYLILYKVKNYSSKDNEQFELYLSLVEEFKSSKLFYNGYFYTFYTRDGVTCAVRRKNAKYEFLSNIMLENSPQDWYPDIDYMIFLDLLGNPLPEEVHLKKKPDYSYKNQRKTISI